MAVMGSIDPSIRKLYALVAASSIVIYTMAAAAGISIDFRSFLFFFASAGLALCGSIYLRIRGDRFLAPMFEILAAGLLLVVPILVSTYLAMAVASPMADARLAALDRALAFDWLALVFWVDRFPLLSEVLLQSYAAFEKQLLLVPVVLCLAAKHQRAAAFIGGYGILCFLSSLIAIGYPALGAYAYYELHQSDLQNINIHFGYHFLESFNAVRSGEPFLLTLGSASGIVTFPSVHAGIAFLIIWACWDIGWLRIPATLLNLSMAFSAITHGSHYLIDIVGAVGVAAVTVIFVEIVFLGRQPAYRLATKTASAR